MSISMEDRLKRRKLDALKRGVHRVTGGEALPVSTHVVGVGKAGVAAIAEILRALDPGAPKFTALAIDIGDHDLTSLRSLAASIPTDRAEVTFVPLQVPSRSDLFNTLGRYSEFLRLEYPRYRWADSTQAWLDEAVALPKAGQHFPRAIAKAVYGYAYYQQPRLLEQTLRAFAADVDAKQSQSMVAVVFGMGGGTGSGIAVDLARHLTNSLFGRRVLVAGIGILPCSADLQQQAEGQLFTLLNELDVLGDEQKNKGVTLSCGDLFRNPFTAGFIVVPQQHLLDKTGDVAETHRRIDQQIATLIGARGGANMWELLRLLNWVAAPSTQHSAARTPWGPRWIHMLASVDMSEPAVLDEQDLPARLGLAAGYAPEFIEIRVSDVDTDATTLAAMIEGAFRPDVPPQLVAGGRDGVAQFILPRIAKDELALFFHAQAAYAAQTPDERRNSHSLLLDQGIVLCEPSTRLAGMAGAGLWGGDNWIAVPLADLWSYRQPLVTTEEAPVRHDARSSV